MRFQQQDLAWTTSQVRFGWLGQGSNRICARNLTSKQQYKTGTLWCHWTMNYMWAQVVNCFSRFPFLSYYLDWFVINRKPNLIVVLLLVWLRGTMERRNPTRTRPGLNGFEEYEWEGDVQESRHRPPSGHILFLFIFSKPFSRLLNTL